MMPRLPLTPAAPPQRRFLFLQGPHGPFLARLGALLVAAGAQVRRVAFNAGDTAFWPDAATLIRFRGRPCDWPATCRALIRRHRITDLVLYGDTRPIHAQAIAIARRQGITVHVFEEGYLRPFWVTYERDGANGHSRLMETGLTRMRRALARPGTAGPRAPPHWGDMRQHVWYGALYHFHVMARHGRFPLFRPHRALPVAREFQLYLRRLLLMPFQALDRMRAERRIARGGYPYHVVLLQLEHDSAFTHHAPFASMTDFLDVVLRGFAEGAPRHHHLVFKAHPLENGRRPLRREIRAMAAGLGIARRVHFVPGGKLARLLDAARSAVTVNSTAGQQALLRGLPLRSFGRAVYDKPELVSRQPLAAFFAKPMPPDSSAYQDYRAYLLQTSQVAGGFYSARGRRQVLRQVVDMMLAPHDPYDALADGQTTRRAPGLRAVG